MKVINLFFSSLILCSTLSQPALAYFTVAESAEILPQGQYRLLIEPQFSTDPSGVNLAAHFDKSLNSSSQIRFEAGFGEIDLFTAFHYKWIPIPDYEKQPAIGLKFSGYYARESEISVLTARVAPMVSKVFQLERGKFVPYAALPIGVSVYKSESSKPLNLAIGAEFIPENLNRMQFGLESGFNLSDSFSYLSLYLSFLFDETRGPRIE